MTQYAIRTAVTGVELFPGDDLTYRLPTMTGGEIFLTVAPVEGPQPTGLLKELYHGETLVASSPDYQPMSPRATFPEADDTWRLRLRLAKTTAKRLYTLTLKYPSTLPILNRRIPLDFFQQGFDNNWNGRNYVTIVFLNNTLVIHFDPELALYYKLTDTDYVLATFPTVDPPNLSIKDIHLSIDSSDGPFETVPGPAPYILLTVSVTGVNGNPISGSVFGFDVNSNDFTINVKFFLTAVGQDVVFVGTDPADPSDADSLRNPHFVGYRAQVTSDLRSKLVNTNSQVEDKLGDLFDGALASAQSYLDAHAGQFGAIITPWLLGAAFDVANVAYSPINSQPVPPSPSPSGAFIPQGDLVIDYVGLPETSSSAGGGIELPPLVLTLTTQTISNGVVGSHYSQDFGAVSGTAPYSWTVTGALPAGLTFAGNLLTGTPTALGVYPIQVTLRDAAGTQIPRSYTFAVNPAGLTISPTSVLPDGAAEQDYSAVFTAQGGTAPYTWSATGLPPGLSMSNKGVISGTLSRSGGLATVVAQATDQHGLTAWSPLTLMVQEHLLFNSVAYHPRGAGTSAYLPPPPPSGGGGFGGGGILQPPILPGDLSKIDHVVVVMMENRSFDCMLGYLSKEGGRTDVEGLKWENDSNRTQFNYYQSKYYYPSRLTDTQAFTVESQGPDHSHESVKAQMADNMGHFVSDYAKNKVGDDSGWLPKVMGYYTGDELPTYDFLAREFAICDHWFCSHPGPTWPNRFVYMTGDLNRDSHGEPEVNTPDYTDFTPSEATTIFDHLNDRGVTWQYFQQRASMMNAFTKYSFDMVNVLEFEDPVKGFVAATQSGLKQVTFIDPLFGDLPAGLNSPQDNDDAPPSDLKFGQMFINGIVTTLFTPASNPNWAKTMLIVVYDEHGGFYDHVQPPSDAVPLTGQVGGKLGPRVPAFVVSPYTPAGMVLKDTFEHGTIAATILRRFCSPHPPVMSPRVTAALDLRGALPLPAPRSDFQLSTQVNWMPPMRTDVRRFKTPRAADSYGALLGGLALNMGSRPKDESPASAGKGGGPTGGGDTGGGGTGGGAVKVSVPGVIGATVAQATKAMVDKGLIAKFSGPTQSSGPHEPTPTVTEQDPSEGTQVDKGSTVSMVTKAVRPQ